MRRNLLFKSFLIAQYLVWYVASIAQGSFEITNGTDKTRIEFERYNNLVVLPVTINGSLTLRFILDTGVQNAILTEKAYADLLQLEYDRKINLAGPGSRDTVNAFVVKDVAMELPGIIGTNRSLLVLEEDFLKLGHNLGVEVYGIIGYEIFSRFIVEIDYDENVLTFHEPDSYTPKRYYKSLPLSIQGTKPYININITQQNDTSINAKLMVDTGASHALLLEEDTDETLTKPGEVLRTSLGRGLAGEISGEVGRLKSVEMDEYKFENVLASFPDPGAYKRKANDGRHGTLGGEILTRFNPVFDYFNNKIYLRKSDEHFKSFEHDMAGIDYIAIGKPLNEIIVTDVWPESPGDLAGIQKLDVITHVNGSRVASENFNFINSLFRLKPGKKIRLRVKRGTRDMKVDFRLRRMI